MSKQELHNLLNDLGGMSAELPKHEQRLKAQLLLKHNLQQNVTRTSPLSAFANLFKGNVTMKSITMAKPIFIIGGFMAITLLGGTSYALLGGWPGVSTLFGGQTELANGDRIVKVSATNCVSEYMDPASKQTSDTADYYYEIKKQSKLTNDQIKQIVQGNCERSKQTQHEQTVGTEAIKSNPANNDRLIFGWYVDSLVKSFDSNGLVIESTIPVGMDNTTGIHNQTIVQRWPHVDPASAVFYGEERISLSDIKAGDHIGIKYRVNDPTIKTMSDHLDPNMDTSIFTVMYITKNLPNVSAAVEAEKYNYDGFSRVYLCDKHPNGFCTMREYYEEKY